MIHNREIYVERVAEIFVWDRVMSVRVLTRNERTSTASVEVCLHGRHFVEKDFLGFSYSSEHQSVVPYADLALISGQGHKLVI